MQCWVVYSDCVKFSKGSSSLEVVDLSRPLKEWCVMGNRKVFKEKGTTHKDSFETGVSIRTWEDLCRQVMTVCTRGCWGGLCSQHHVVGP